MSHWFYRQSEKEFGPLRPSEILTHIRQGTIRPETLIRKGDSQWVTAQSVDGLFDAATTQDAAELICPFCGETIDRPPTQCKNCYREVVLLFKGMTQVERDKETEFVDSQGARIEAQFELKRRKDVAVYSTLLLIWLLLLISAPILTHLAMRGYLGVEQSMISTGIGITAIVFGVISFLLTKSH